MLGDIENDANLVAEIDELKYRLKVAKTRSPMMLDFELQLNQFIKKYCLGWSQHDFARLPEKE